MSKVLVSILSNHSLPNYLFAKEMRGKYDKMLFITTPEVSGMCRGKQLEDALRKEEDTVPRITVDGNDYKQAVNTLIGAGLSDKDAYIVNLTGGTKMMSLAVHDFFSKKNSTFYYVPIGKNTYYNMSTGESSPLQYRVSLGEYFKLYGLRYTHNSELLKSEDYTLKLYNEVKRNGFNLTERMLHARDEDSKETAEDKRYLSGEWFEEYTYLRIKRQYNLKDNAIALSLKINRNEDDDASDNELDVVFILNNVLYVVECKVTMFGGGKPQQKIEEYLYKLAAISKDFGLQVRPYLFTLHNMESLPPESRASIDKRCKILGIRGIVGRRELSEEELKL